MREEVLLPPELPSSLTCATLGLKHAPGVGNERLLKAQAKDECAVVLRTIAVSGVD